MDREQQCVVVGIDFSDGAAGAVREGRWLASRAGLDLQALHVLGPGESWSPDLQTTEWLRSFALEPSGLFLRRGLAWVEIVRHAREVSAALIVVGCHGASGAQAMSIGSTASRVALRAPCPVLFVARWREGLPSDDVMTESRSTSRSTLEEKP